ncbi:MAG: tetratricopeptide repeat protein [Granulosicoccus sp.]
MSEMTGVDSRGHIITSTSASAVACCVGAFDSYAKRRADVIPQLQASIDADGDCALTQAAFGLLLFGARHQDLQPAASAALVTAKEHYASATSRERRFVDALDFALQGKLDKVIATYQTILNDHPTDLFAHSLCQAELFWLGDMQRSERISARTEKHWSEKVCGYGEFLAIRAFDLEETNQFEAAERAGRQAVDMDNSNIWATHAVTHVMHMQARFDEGVSWLTGLQDHWEESNQMKLHVWWHKALFHLERGEQDAVFDAYDKWIRNRSLELVEAMPDLYIDLQNGASMLWRMEQAGLDVAHRWQEMADVVVHRLGDMGSPFTSAHYAIILAAVGDFASCDLLVEKMQHFIHADSHTLADHFAGIALPAAEAAIAHRKGNYQLTVEKLMPARHRMYQMGGSHAQQDLFYQILVDAAYKLQRAELVSTLLQEIERIGFLGPAQRIAYADAAKAQPA